VDELARRARHREEIVMAGPALIETYSVLTRLLPPYRLRPADARAVMEGSWSQVEVAALAGTVDWDKANGILTTLRRETEDDPRLRSLRRAWLLAAVRYAQARAEWFLAPREERVARDQHRTRLHDAFIDSCNALSRNLAQLDRDVDWRRRLGDDRKAIGDLACYLHCLLGLEAR
jgi:hypothetical protein